MKQRSINVVSTLCNVNSTLFQPRTLTLYQHCATLKIQRQILFHFQRRINVISTLILNVETTLIRPWNVGWVLEYCSWWSLSFCKVSTLPFRVLISYFTSYFSFLSFSKSSNLLDRCWTNSVSSASCLSPIICIDFVSLQKTYISVAFSASFSNFTSISEISLCY